MGWFSRKHTPLGEQKPFVFGIILHIQDSVYYLVRSDFVVDLLNAHFSGSHVATLHTEKHSHASNQVRNLKSS